MGDLNSLRPRENGCRFPDDIFKPIFLKENIWISIKISLKIVPKSPITNIATLVGLVPNKQQAIIWTNDGWITHAYMRHSASMS